MNNWGCPHLTGKRCRRINGRCDPASEKCVLSGKVRRAGSSSTEKNIPKDKEKEGDFKSGKGKEPGE